MTDLPAYREFFPCDFGSLYGEGACPDCRRVQQESVPREEYDAQRNKHSTIEGMANVAAAEGYSVVQVIVFPGRVYSRTEAVNSYSSEMQTVTNTSPAEWSLLCKRVA